MRKYQVIGGVVLVFVIGVVCGAIATHFFYRSHLDSIISDRMQSKEDLLVRRLQGRLDLDQSQQKQIRAIVHQTHTQVEMVRARLRPETESVIEKGQAQIMDILTADQKPRYVQMVAERKEKLRKRGLLP